MTKVSRIRIATRSSRLALWQAEHVAGLLTTAHPNLSVELVRLVTTGDVNLTAPLSQLGSDGVFTREVQLALLDGRADVAVHSLKDLPTAAHPELILAAVPPRGDMYDALVLPRGQAATGLNDLPTGAKVGTSSPRRQAQLRFLRPDLELLDVRGNVETRLKKLDAGEYDALMLAVAGLSRLELGERISVALKPPEMYPAVGQGALGLECLSSATGVREILAQISDLSTLNAVTAERSLLAELRAGCHAPLGVYSSQDSDASGRIRQKLEAVVLSAEGTERLTAFAQTDDQGTAELGQAVAKLLMSQGASRFLNKAT